MRDRNICRVDAIGGSHGNGCSTKVHGYLVGSDGTHAALVNGTVVGIERVGPVGGDGAKVDHLLDDHCDRALEMGPQACKANNFALHPILLVSKF